MLLGNCWGKIYIFQYTQVPRSYDLVIKTKTKTKTVLIAFFWMRNMKLARNDAFDNTGHEDGSWTCTGRDCIGKGHLPWALSSPVIALCAGLQHFSIFWHWVVSVTSHIDTRQIKVTAARLGVGWGVGLSGLLLIILFCSLFKNSALLAPFCNMQLSSGPIAPSCGTWQKELMQIHWWICCFLGCEQFNSLSLTQESPVFC